jgi:hypothetical protein
MLFGGGLLVSLLPFLILLSAFASSRIDDDIALRLGLDRRASGIVSHLFTSSPASLNVATATSLVFVAAGTLAVAGSLQQIYEKVFHQDHRGLRGLYRLLIWTLVLCLVVAAEAWSAGRFATPLLVSGWSSSPRSLSGRRSSGGRCTSCWRAGSHGAGCSGPRHSGVMSVLACRADSEVAGPGVAPAGGGDVAVASFMIRWWLWQRGQAAPHQTPHIQHFCHKTGL